MSILEKDAQHVWHPFTQAQIAPQPIPVVSAKGAWLFTEDNKKYYDANSSWWTVLHGHCHPYITEKITEQLSTLDHVIFAGATHPKGVEVAERISNYLPNHFQKVFFSDNGSTSVEVAIKMVYQYWFNKEAKNRKRFVAISGAYHGDTFGAMSVGERDYFNRPFEHLFFDVDYLPFPTNDNWDEVLAKATELFSSGEVAGFIFEPLVQGASGMRMYSPAQLETLVALAKKYETITIADEVMTGFYRTGKPFAINHIDSEVDIICLSKGLTAGILPMGLTVTTQKMYDAFLHDEVAKGFLHGHSFTGNPIICAAICASLDLLEKKETLENIDLIVKSHEAFAKELEGHEYFKNVRQQGTILALEVNVEGMSSYFSSIRNEAYQFYLDHGILLRPLGNVIFINPPYCATHEDLKMVYEVTMKFLASWFKA
ncbi:MAG: adenosylmethionine--8-amino-7-oxononanoate transaminase [Crocinitomicaceae bacterium]